MKNEIKGKWITRTFPIPINRNEMEIGAVPTSNQKNIKVGAEIGAIRIAINKKKIMTRAVSLLTSGFFLVSQVVSANPGAGIEIAVTREMPSFLRIDIPSELATLDGLYEAPARQDPKLILHIQNAHANYGAQQKIKELLQYLEKHYAIKTIFVEGASEDLNPDYLKMFPDQERNLKLAEFLAKQGELTGAELYLLEQSGERKTGNGEQNVRRSSLPESRSEAVKAHGIEDAGLYRENYEALKKVFGAEVTVKRYLNGFEGRLSTLASKVFSKDLLKLLGEWRKFEKGHREFMPYVKGLAAESKRVLGIDLGSLLSQIEWPQITRLLVLQTMEKELDIQKGLAERDHLIKFLKEKRVSAKLITAIENFQDQQVTMLQGTHGGVAASVQPRDLMEQLVTEAGPKGFNFYNYPHFSLYAGYLILKSEMDPKGLFSEIRVLFTQILDQLAVSQHEKKLLELYRSEELVRKLLNLELTRKDWQEVLAKKDLLAMDPLVAELKEIGTAVSRESGLPLSNFETKPVDRKFREEVTKVQTAAYGFYEAARRREDVFYEKIDSVMRKESLNKAVLITGGFHTDGITELLREHEISYGTLTPRLSEKSDESLYRNVMLQNKPQLFDVSCLENALREASLKTLEDQGMIRAKVLASMLDAAVHADGRSEVRDILPDVNVSSFAMLNEIQILDNGQKNSEGRSVYKVSRSEARGVARTFALAALLLGTPSVSAGGQVSEPTRQTSAASAQSERLFFNDLFGAIQNQGIFKGVNDKDLNASIEFSKKQAVVVRKAQDLLIDRKILAGHPANVRNTAVLFLGGIQASNYQKINSTPDSFALALMDQGVVVVDRSAYEAVRETERATWLAVKIAHEIQHILLGSNVPVLVQEAETYRVTYEALKAFGKESEPQLKMQERVWRAFSVLAKNSGEVLTSPFKLKSDQIGRLNYDGLWLDTDMVRIRIYDMQGNNQKSVMFGIDGDGKIHELKAIPAVPRKQEIRRVQRSEVRGVPGVGDQAIIPIEKITKSMMRLSSGWKDEWEAKGSKKESPLEPASEQLSISPVAWVASHILEIAERFDFGIDTAGGGLVMNEQGDFGHSEGPTTWVVVPSTVLSSQTLAGIFRDKVRPGGILVVAYPQGEVPTISGSVRGSPEEQAETGIESFSAGSLEDLDIHYIVIRKSGSVAKGRSEMRENFFKETSDSFPEMVSKLPPIPEEARQSLNEALKNRNLFYQRVERKGLGASKIEYHLADLIPIFEKTTAVSPSAAFENAAPKEFFRIHAEKPELFQLPVEDAKKFLEHVRFYHLEHISRFPFTFLDFGRNVYFRDLKVNLNGESLNITQALVVSDSKLAQAEITEFFLVNGVYVGYGVTRYMGPTDVWLQFNLFPRVQGSRFGRGLIPGLSKAIYQMRMETLRRMLDDGAVLTVEERQFPSAGALGFYLSLGFEPWSKSPKLKLPQGTISSREFKKLKPQLKGGLKHIFSRVKSGEDEQPEARSGIQDDSGALLPGRILRAGMKPELNSLLDDVGKQRLIRMDVASGDLSGLPEKDLAELVGFERLNVWTIQPAIERIASHFAKEIALLSGVIPAADFPADHYEKNPYFVVVRDLVANAYVHGNRLDGSKPVYLYWTRHDHYLEIGVVDAASWRTESAWERVWFEVKRALYGWMPASKRITGEQSALKSFPGMQTKHHLIILDASSTGLAVGRIAVRSAGVSIVTADKRSEMRENYFKETAAPFPETVEGLKPLPEDVQRLLGLGLYGAKKSLMRQAQKKGGAATTDLELKLANIAKKTDGVATYPDDDFLERPEISDLLESMKSAGFEKLQPSLARSFIDHVRFFNLEGRYFDSENRPFVPFTYFDFGKDVYFKTRQVTFNGESLNITQALVLSAPGVARRVQAELTEFFLVNGVYVGCGVTRYENPTRAELQFNIFPEIPDSRFGRSQVAGLSKAIYGLRLEALEQMLVDGAVVTVPEHQFSDAKTLGFYASLKFTPWDSTVTLPTGNISEEKFRELQPQLKAGLKYILSRAEARSEARDENANRILISQLGNFPIFASNQQRDSFAAWLRLMGDFLAPHKYRELLPRTYNNDIPSDLTLAEAFQWMAAIRKLPLGNGQEILSGLAMSFTKAAVLMAQRAVQQKTVPTTVQTMISGFYGIGLALSKETLQVVIPSIKEIAGQSSGEITEIKIFDWLGLTPDERHQFQVAFEGGSSDIMDIVLEKAIRVAAKAVRIELKALTYFRGQRFYKNDLDRADGLMRETRVAIREKLKEARQSGSPEKMREAQISVIRYITLRVSKFPGWVQANDRIYLEASPAHVRLTDEINCLGRTALIAMYLEELGNEGWLEGVKVESAMSSNHVKLTVEFGGNKYWLDAAERFKRQFLPRADAGSSSAKAFRVGPLKEGIMVGVLNNLGSGLSTQGKYEEAIVAFREALRIDPGYASVRCNLGAVLFARGDVEGAIASYREALRLDPSYVLAYRELGHALTVQGEMDKAIDAYRNAIDIDPKDARTHYYLGLALFAQAKADPKHIDIAKVEEAAGEFLAAIGIDSGKTEFHFAYGDALQVLHAAERKSGAGTARSESRLDSRLARSEVREGEARAEPPQASSWKQKWVTWAKIGIMTASVLFVMQLAYVFYLQERGSFTIDASKYLVKVVTGEENIKQAIKSGATYVAATGPFKEKKGKKKPIGGVWEDSLEKSPFIVSKSAMLKGILRVGRDGRATIMAAADFDPKNPPANGFEAGPIAVRNGVVNMKIEPWNAGFLSGRKVVLGVDKAGNVHVLDLYGWDIFGKTGPNVLRRSVKKWADEKGIKDALFVDGGNTGVRLFQISPAAALMALPRHPAPQSSNSRQDMWFLALGSLFFGVSSVAAVSLGMKPSRNPRSEMRDGEAEGGQAEARVIEEARKILDRRSGELETFGRSLEAMSPDTALHWSRAVLSWTQLVRDMLQPEPFSIEKTKDKKTEGLYRSELNRFNYRINQYDVREAFSWLMFRLSKGELPLDLFKSTVETMHRYLLIGKTGQRMYFPSTLPEKQRSRDSLAELAVQGLRPFDDEVDSRLWFVLNRLYEIAKADGSRSVNQIMDALASIYVIWFGDFQDGREDMLFSHGNNGIILNIINGILALYGLNEISFDTLDFGFFKDSKAKFQDRVKLMAEELRKRVQAANKEKNLSLPVASFLRSPKGVSGQEKEERNRSEARASLTSLNAEIENLETRIGEIGPASLPTLGFHGQARRENATYFYFTFRGKDLFGRDDARMSPDEFLERLQGTVIYTAKYSEYDYSRGILPLIHLLANQGEFKLDASNEKSLTDELKIIDPYQKKMSRFKYFGWEGVAPRGSVPPKKAIREITVTSEEFSEIDQEAQAAAKPEIGVEVDDVRSYWAYRALYKKTLEAILKIASAEATGVQRSEARNADDSAEGRAITAIREEPKVAYYPGGLDVETVLKFFPNLKTVHFFNLWPFSVPFQENELVNAMGPDSKDEVGMTVFEKMMNRYLMYSSSLPYIPTSFQQSIFAPNSQPQIGVEPFIRADLVRVGATQINVREINAGVHEIKFKDPSGEDKRIIYHEEKIDPSSPMKTIDPSTEKADLLFVKAFDDHFAEAFHPSLLSGLRSGALLVSDFPREKIERYAPGLIGQNAASLGILNFDLLEVPAMKALRNNIGYSKDGLTVYRTVPAMQGRSEVRKEEQMTFENAIGDLKTKDGGLYEHSVRVRDLSRLIAEHLGLSSADVEMLSAAAILHDLGKIVVSDDILHKPGSLDIWERGRIDYHSEIGAALVPEIPYRKKVEQIIRMHHSETTDLLTNIVTAADYFDARTSKRPYIEKPLSPEAAIAALRKEIPSINPKVVNALEEIVIHGKGKPRSEVRLSTPSGAVEGEGDRRSEARIVLEAIPSADRSVVEQARLGPNFEAVNNLAAQGAKGPVIVAAVAGMVFDGRLKAEQMADVIIQLASASVVKATGWVNPIRDVFAGLSGKLFGKSALIEIMDKQGFEIELVSADAIIELADLGTLANKMQRKAIVLMADGTAEVAAAKQRVKEMELRLSKTLKELNAEKRFNMIVVDKSHPEAARKALDRFMTIEMKTMPAISRGPLGYVFMGSDQFLKVFKTDTGRGLMIKEPYSQDVGRRVATSTLASIVSQRILSASEADAIKEVLNGEKDENGFRSFSQDALTKMLAIAMQVMQAIQSAA